MLDLLLSCFFAFLFFYVAAQAQTAPQLLITWRSRAYVEPSFQGKILPVAGAPLEASAMMIDAGKPVDLSKQTIRWFLNNRLLQSGTGLQTVAVPGDPLLRDAEIRLKVVIAGYKGADQQAVIVLQPTRPEVIIRPTYPEWYVPAGNALFRAMFYHWSAESPDALSLRWSLQGQTVESFGEGAALAAEIPAAAAGNTLSLQLTANNTANALEAASAFAQLLITK